MNKTGSPENPVAVSEGSAESGVELSRLEAENAELRAALESIMAIYNDPNGEAIDGFFGIANVAEAALAKVSRAQAMPLDPKE